MDKRKITLSVIAIAVLLVVLVGSTYAYWTLNGTPKVSANVQVQTGGLILRLDDTEGSITTNDVIDPNHLSFSKYFNITNESAADGYAKLLFKGLTNTFVTDALVYDLEEVQSDKSSFTEPRMIITNQVLPKVTNSNATLADGLLIEHGTVTNNTVTPNTKYYKLTVRYKYSDTVNQNADLNQTLISGFTMEEGQAGVNMTLSFNTSRQNVTNPENKSVTMNNIYGELPIVVDGDYFTESWYTDSLLTEKVESNSKVLKSGNHTLYAHWEKIVRCIDDNGKTVVCPQTLTIGQRVAVGNETFRYLRTTDTTSNLNECGTTSWTPCGDTSTNTNAVIKTGSGYLRLLAEYNLYVSSIYTYNGTKIRDITSDELGYGLQSKIARGAMTHENSVGSTLYAAQGQIRTYSNSYVKGYIDYYIDFLNNTFFNNIIIDATPVTRSEMSYVGCKNSSSDDACLSTPEWFRNTTYWSCSSSNEYVYYVDSNGSSYGGNNAYQYGVRPVIMISETDFNHYR